jgi:hypothetical protein
MFKQSANHNTYFRNYQNEFISLVEMLYSAKTNLSLNFLIESHIIMRRDISITMVNEFFLATDKRKKICFDYLLYKKGVVQQYS